MSDRRNRQSRQTVQGVSEVSDRRTGGAHAAQEQRTVTLEWIDEDDADVERWHQEFRQKVGPLIFDVEVDRWNREAEERMRAMTAQRQSKGDE
jgi:hypothetical protein